MKQWNTWLENGAVRVLTMSESKTKRAELKKKGNENRVVASRFVLTDKNDGLRTELVDLPLDASARIVIPGYKVKENLEGKSDETPRRATGTASMPSSSWQARVRSGTWRKAT